MTRVLLDACVLYPTVMRDILLGVAARGGFTPLWSARILEEWARATAKLGAVAQAQARGEIALLCAQWPRANVQPRQGDLARLYLPDPDDVHVLAAAIAGSADLLVTQNRRDFPQHLLADEGLQRKDADGFLYDLWLHDADLVSAAVHAVHERATQLDGVQMPLRALLKKAKLPKLAKAVSAGL